MASLGDIIGLVLPLIMGKQVPQELILELVAELQRYGDEIAGLDRMADGPGAGVARRLRDVAEWKHAVRVHEITRQCSLSSVDVLEVSRAACPPGPGRVVVRDDSEQEYHERICRFISGRLGIPYDEIAGKSTAVPPAPRRAQSMSDPCKREAENHSRAELIQFLLGQITGYPALHAVTKAVQERAAKFKPGLGALAEAVPPGARYQAARDLVVDLTDAAEADRIAADALHWARHLRGQEPAGSTGDGCTSVLAEGCVGSYLGRDHDRATDICRTAFDLAGASFSSADAAMQEILPLYESAYRVVRALADEDGQGE